MAHVSKTRRLADQLGYLSFAIGFAELFAPRAVARLAGLEGREKMLRLFGLREVASGAAILAGGDPTLGVWSRVVGDVLDVAAVAGRLRQPRGDRAKTMATLATLTLVAALDLECALNLGSQNARRAQPRRDYSMRSGYPRGLAASQGVASDFEVPHDMRIPELLRPYTRRATQDTKSGGSSKKSARR